MASLNNYYMHDIVKTLLDRIDVLMATVDDLSAKVADLTAVNETLTEKVKTLEESLNKNSKNSSKPPSSDGLSKPDPKSLRKVSGKKKGAQVGHRGSGFKLLKAPDEVVLHTPTQCNGCDFVGKCITCKTSEIRYEVDIQVQTKVIAHKTLSRMCSLENGTIVSGSFPQNITSTMQYGDNLEAFVITLNTAGMMGIKRTHDILGAVFGVPISTGTIFSMVRNCADSLKGTVERIRQTICALPLLHFDETGVRVDKKLHWVHSASNPSYTYLTVEHKRGSQGMDSSGVLPNFQGTAVHDFWMPYYKYHRIRHAACNTHLLREMTGVIENHPLQTWAEDMMQLMLRMKAVKEYFVRKDRVELSDYILCKFGLIYDAIVEKARNQNPVEDKPVGKRGRQKKGKLRALVERFANFKAEICLFINDFTVPFENNQAERDIRMIKVKQKVAGCFRTKEGADAFALIMSYIGTANKQGKNSYSAIKSALDGRSESLIFGQATE